MSVQVQSQMKLRWNHWIWTLEVPMNHLHCMMYLLNMSLLYTIHYLYKKQKLYCLITYYTKQTKIKKMRITYQQQKQMEWQRNVFEVQAYLKALKKKYFFMCAFLRYEAISCSCTVVDNRKRYKFSDGVTLAFDPVIWTR